MLHVCAVESAAELVVRTTVWAIGVSVKATPLDLWQAATAYTGYVETALRSRGLAAIHLCLDGAIELKALTARFRAATAFGGIGNSPCGVRLLEAAARRRLATAFRIARFVNAAAVSVLRAAVGSIHLVDVAALIVGSAAGGLMARTLAATSRRIAGAALIKTTPAVATVCKTIKQRVLTRAVAAALSFCGTTIVNEPMVCIAKLRHILTLIPVGGEILISACTRRCRQ